jgi:hypothetical protein
MRCQMCDQTENGLRDTIGGVRSKITDVSDPKRPSGAGR